MRLAIVAGSFVALGVCPCDAFAFTPALPGGAYSSIEDTGRRICPASPIIALPPYVPPHGPSPLWAGAASIEAKRANDKTFPSQEWKAARPVQVVCVVPGNGARGQLNASWVEVMEHLNTRIGFIDPQFELRVVTMEDLAEGGTLALPMLPPDVMFFLSVEDQGFSEHLRDYLVKEVPNVIALNTSEALMSLTHIGPARPNTRILSKVWRTLPVPTKRKNLLKVYDTVKGFWERGHADDLYYMILVVINAAVTNIPAVSEILKPLTFKALTCMVRNCRKQIIDCQKNPACKAALTCLERCPPNDQVCRYKCIVEHESREFEQFALCILQKHNCLQNHAVIQMRPDPQPISTFRGQAVTFESAEEILFAHLGDKPYSWKVICGQNAAYDAFPAQHMTFYRRNKQVWYLPVFGVIKSDGSFIWLRRRYRVRRGKVPGTFFFSVLDNGVTSNEFWRIVDVADDLSWVLFYYSGAAAAAGQSYQGAIFASTDGKWPENREGYIDRLTGALDRCGIKLWELFQVRHEGFWSGPGYDKPPLDIDHD